LRDSGLDSRVCHRSGQFPSCDLYPFRYIYEEVENSASFVFLYIMLPSMELMGQKRLDISTRF